MRIIRLLMPMMLAGCSSFTRTTTGSLTNGGSTNISLKHCSPCLVRCSRAIRLLVYAASAVPTIE